MRFMFQYPDLHGSAADLLEAGSVVDVARAVELAGWHGISFTEHPAPGARWLDAGGHQTLDPFVALAAAGAVTSHLTLLTYLAVVPYRNPMLLAKAAATVDQVSNGRFVLGAGTGYLKTEFFALGVDFDERNALFDEVLDVLPLHWKGEPFSYEGRHFNARDVLARPRPVQNPIPVWIGGNSTLTLRRIAQRGQGWMPLTGDAAMATTTRTPHLDTIDSIGERLAMLRDFAGERYPTLDIAVPYFGVTNDGVDVAVAQHRDDIERIRELGATWVVIACPWGPASKVKEFIEGFATTYISPADRGKVET
jgi:probable F420-dependent oxidoreductase